MVYELSYIKMNTVYEIYFISLFKALCPIDF